MAFKKDGEVKVFKLKKTADSSMHKDEEFERLLVDDLVKSDSCDELVERKGEKKKNKHVLNKD